MQEAIRGLVSRAAAEAVEKRTRWWRVRDVAEYRGVRTRTVYAWVARAKAMRARGEEGGIPFSQPAGTKALRFRPEAIRRFFGDCE